MQHILCKRKNSAVFYFRKQPFLKWKLEIINSFLQKVYFIAFRLYTQAQFWMIPTIKPVDNESITEPRIDWDIKKKKKLR